VIQNDGIVIIAVNLFTTKVVKNIHFFTRPGGTYVPVFLLPKVAFVNHDITRKYCTINTYIYISYEIVGSKTFSK